MAGPFVGRPGATVEGMSAEKERGVPAVVLKCPQKGAILTGKRRRARATSLTHREGLLTRREAADIAGTSLAAVDKAIEQRVLPVHRRGRQALIDADGVAVIAILRDIGLPLPVSVKQEVKTWIISTKPHRRSGQAELRLGGGPLTVKCTTDVRARSKAGETYARMRDRHITSDPEIFGGEPIIKGTRLLVQTIAQRLDGGDSFERLLSEHPHVSKSALATAYRFAKTNPPRGRPRKPWRNEGTSGAASQIAG
jgi:uncharacterized protein (DUF433 family)